MRVGSILLTQNVAKANEFDQAQPRPLAEANIDEERENNYPRIVEDKCFKERLTDDKVADDRNDERFESEDECRFRPLLDLCSDKFFREGNHNEERENINGRQTGALERPSDKENEEDSTRDNGEGDRHSGEIEEAERFEGEAREHADRDDREKNGDAILQTFLPKSEKGKGDNGWSVDAEGFDPDDLAEECDQGGDEGQSEEEIDSVDGDTTGKEVLNERVYCFHTIEEL